MKIKFEIDYYTVYGQVVCVLGNLPELGSNDDNHAFALSYMGNSIWQGEIETDAPGTIEYTYLLKEGDRVVRTEWGEKRSIIIPQADIVCLADAWHNEPEEKYLYTSAFRNSLFRTEAAEIPAANYKRTLRIKLDCPYVQPGQTVVMCGESGLLGNWQAEQAVHLYYTDSGCWEVQLDEQQIQTPLSYKFALLNIAANTIVHWEQGENRVFIPQSFCRQDSCVYIQEAEYRYGKLNWKGAGVAIPVFSLRSKDSFGIGEFSDLKKMIDWAKLTGMKFIQILPINDTTTTHTRADSYPYNAISIYALHPVYLGLNDFPLKDGVKWNSYRKKANALNALPVLDYEKTEKLKRSYIRDLYEEQGADIIKSATYKSFVKQNASWLFPYACFSYFREYYHTASHPEWKKFSRYNEKLLKEEIKKNTKMKQAVELACFTQYLLHIQLKGVKEYAHQNGVVLKGDIPIGINRNSVEAWVEPHLFNMDTQTGAPPDDFSIFGQNWGFPTYNWTKMAKTGYQWWIRRFRKMADYFDAYRIDHILGFFRIWEIPLDSVQGLLGYFSPALPYTREEIEMRGLAFDEQRMLAPYIHEKTLDELFGEHAAEVKAVFLKQLTYDRYELKEFCNTQRKIRIFFEGKPDDKSVNMRQGLYKLCNEVLFIRDKYEPKKYHPRISAQYTVSYSDLSGQKKEAYNRLYEEFFYHRHNEFWANEAMKKLPALIRSTEMLVCGEDLGMIPECVPSVMRQLQILSLEIQRMPKQAFRMFDDLSRIPYFSVCTTSTHDMSLIRAWWKENKEVTQRYYNEVLWKEGEAPEDCTPEICRQIISNHLNSSAMLTILPLQDWLSMDAEHRRKNPEEERINIPAIADHYWQYRMHLTLEDLLDAYSMNNEIAGLIQTAGRSQYEYGV